MASFFNMKGTTQNEFQVGIKGPIISRDTANGILNLPNSLIDKLFLGSTYDANKYLTSSQYTGNSATTTKLATPRKIGLTGGAIGEVSFDGSKDVSLSVSKITGNYIDWENITTKIPYSILPTGTKESTIATGDHNHDDAYLKLSGGTVTGDLTLQKTLNVPTINSIDASTKITISTGTHTDSYFQSQKFRGQGDASSYHHAIDFGYAGRDHFDFYEYGGKFNFWQNQQKTAVSSNNCLVASLQLGKLVERGHVLTYPGKDGTIAVTDDLKSKQDTLTTKQLAVVNNGVTSVTDTGTGAKITKFTTENNTITVTRESLVAADIPDLSADKITSGTVSINRLPFSTSIGTQSTDTSLATAKAVYSYASPKTGSSSLTTYSGGTLGDAAAKGVAKTITSTSTDEGLTTAKAVYSFVNSKLTGVYTFKGTITRVATDDTGKITPVIISGDSIVSNVNGYIYNVSESFTYLGETYPAGTNIVYEDESSDGTENGIWKPLGGSFDVDLSNYQKVDADLTSIAGLTGTSGFLRKKAENSWELDTGNYAGSGSAGGPAKSVQCYNGTDNLNRYVYFADSTASTSAAILGYNTNLMFNPVGGKLTATEFIGKLTGNASTATLAEAAKKLNTAVNFTIGSATAKSFDGTTELSWTLSDIGAAASSHTHGNITNDGKLQTNDVTIANGDKLIITDSSDSSKITRSSLSFDGSTTNKFLSKKGTWESAGTVTSVTLKAGNGISIDNSAAITGSGERTISNSGVLKLGTRTGEIKIDDLKTDLGLKSNAYTDTKYLPLTGGTVTGQVTFDNCNQYDGIKSVNIRRNSSDLEKLSTYLDDGNVYFRYTNDETTSQFTFVLENLDKEGKTEPEYPSTNAIRFYSGGNDYPHIYVDRNYDSNQKQTAEVLTETNYSSWASPLAGSSSLTTYSGGTLGKAAAKGIAEAITSNSTDLATAKAVYDYSSPKAGSTSITTLGTITSGTWQGDILGKVYVPSDTVYTNDTQTIINKTFTKSTYNGLLLTAAAIGFTISGGSSTSKTLTVNESYTLGAACEKNITTSISENDAGLATSGTIYSYLTNNYAATSHTHSYLPLTGSGTSTTTTEPTNALTGNLWFKRTDGIKVFSHNDDLKIWEVVGNDGSYASQYGFYEKYNGTKAGNDNSLTLYADNCNGSHVLVRSILQDGTITWSTDNKFNNNVTAASFNNVKLTAAATGFTISGGTTSKTLTVGESYTLGAACEKSVSTAISSSSTANELATAKAIYDYAAPKSHTHTITKMWVNDIRNKSNLPTDTDNYNGQFWFSNKNCPSNNWYSGISINGWDVSNQNYQCWQIASSSITSSDDNRLYFRISKNKSSWNNWHPIAFTSDTFTNSTYNGLSLTATETGFTISGGTDSKTLTVNKSYTLGDACEKGIITDSSNITSTSTDLPTGKAVYDFVAAKVSSAVQYLGTVNATANDSLLWSTKLVHSDSNVIGKGDFFRSTAAFTLPAGTTNTTNSLVHKGDIIIALVDAPSAANTDTYVVSHVEIDTNTWTANTSSAAGYVAAGSGQANKVWKTDANGNPSWRDDANTTYTFATGDSAGQIKVTPSSGTASNISVKGWNTAATYDVTTDKASSSDNTRLITSSGVASTVADYLPLTGGVITKTANNITSNVRVGGYMTTSNGLPKVDNETLPNNGSAVCSNGIAMLNPGNPDDAVWMRVTGTNNSDTCFEIATGDDGDSDFNIHFRGYMYSTNAPYYDIVLPKKSGTVALTTDIENVYQKVDADLTSIAGLTGTAGFLKKKAENTWELDTNNYASSDSAGGPAKKAVNLTGTTSYSVPYQSASGTTAYVAPNTTTTKKFFTMTGNGSNGAAPSWTTLVNGDIPTALTGKTYNGISITNTENTSVVFSGAKTLTLKGNLTVNSDYTLGAACAKGVTNDAGGISSSGTNLTTGKAVYLYAENSLAKKDHGHGQMNNKGQLTTIVGTEGSYDSSYIPLIYGSTIGSGSDTNLLIKSALTFNANETNAGSKFLAKSGKFVDATTLGFATQANLNNAYQTAGNTSSSSKLYIIGVDSVGSSNGSYKTTHYASANTYAQGDKLHSGTVVGYTEVQSAKVSVGTVSSNEVTTKASMQYNSTDDCIEFVFA